MNLSNSFDRDSLKDFNEEFFKQLEDKEDDCKKYIKEICSKYKITDTSEVNAMIIYYFWNLYFSKFFPNVIDRKIINKDPRNSSLFKYCYKLQKDSKGILEQNDYKDYVYCQIRFLKSYKDKTNSIILVSPNILNIEKGWKKWKYFKYLMSNKDKHSINNNNKYINNQNLKVSLIEDKKFIESKIGKLSKNLVLNNVKNIIFWNKIGSVSVYFLSICDLIDKKLIQKDLSVYNFDDNGKNIYKTIFHELF